MTNSTLNALQLATGNNRKRLLQLLQNENNDTDIADDPYFSDMPLTEMEMMSSKQAEQQAKRYAEAKNGGRSGRTFDTGNDAELMEIRESVQRHLRKRKQYITDKDK